MAKPKLDPTALREYLEAGHSQADAEPSPCVSCTLEVPVVGRQPAVDHLADLDMASPSQNRRGVSSPQ